MKILRGEKAGFCMGVALALRKLENAVNTRPYGGVATMGPIIHNPQVLEELAKKGVKRIAAPTEAAAGMTVLIRAHGITRSEEEALRSRGVTLIDATCPKVKKAQLAIAEATKEGRTLLLYGEAEHPEVRGLLSYAGGPCRVFSRPEDLEAAEAELLSGVGFVLAAQTTQDRRTFDQLRAVWQPILEDRLHVLDTICDATRERQEETIRLAKDVDAMVVVGGLQSGNTRRLAEIAKRGGVRTVHVETASALKEDFFAGTGLVGLTAGASTPKSIIDAVEQQLLSLAKKRDNH